MDQLRERMAVEIEEMLRNESLRSDEVLRRRWRPKKVPNTVEFAKKKLPTSRLKQLLSKPPKALTDTQVIQLGDHLAVSSPSSEMTELAAQQMLAADPEAFFFVPPKPELGRGKNGNGSAVRRYTMWMQMAGAPLFARFGRFDRAVRGTRLLVETLVSPAWERESGAGRSGDTEPAMHLLLAAPALYGVAANYPSPTDCPPQGPGRYDSILRETRRLLTTMASNQPLHSPCVVIRLGALSVVSRCAEGLPFVEQSMKIAQESWEAGMVRAFTRALTYQDRWFISEQQSATGSLPVGQHGDKVKQRVA